MSKKFLIKLRNKNKADALDSLGIVVLNDLYY